MTSSLLELLLAAKNSVISIGFDTTKMNLVIMIFIFSGLKSGENTDEKSRIIIKKPRNSRIGYHP